MPKSVRYLIPIVFKIAIVLGIGSQNGCDFTGYTWFLGNTDLHFSPSDLRAQIRNLEIGIKKKSVGIINGLGCYFLGAERIVFSITNRPAVRCIPD
jgi:hypothetical protein